MSDSENSETAQRQDRTDLDAGIAAIHRRSSIHPGAILATELDYLAVAPAQLAQQIDVPVDAIVQLIDGSRGVDTDMAARLSKWFGTSAAMLLTLQSTYDACTAGPRF